jgi:hypothetical protein
VNLSVEANKSTQHQNPEQHHHPHCHENLKPHGTIFSHHSVPFIHASFSGHIGRTFQAKKPQPGLDPFSVKNYQQGPRPLSGLDPSDEEYAESKWCYDTPGVVHPDQVCSEDASMKI